MRSMLCAIWLSFCLHFHTFLRDPQITCADGLVSQAGWPQANVEWLVSDKIEIAVQVNGKVRATLLLPVDCDKQKAEENAGLDAVKKHLNNKSPKRVIFVKNRIINVVC